MTITAREFIHKWQAGSPAHALTERAGAQAHFIDLCRLLGVPEPGDPERYCFERGVTRTGSERQRVDGFADVWLRGHFAWEYKAPGRSLDGALRQLMMYALPLESPPLLVVSDRQRIEIHTHFTGTPSERHVVLLEDLARPEAQALLRALWTEPERFRPRRSNREITEQAASTFAATAERLRGAGVASAEVSHFLTQCLFCFFAEDVGLLPQRLFERLVGVRVEPARLRAQLQQLFETMRGGGLFGVDDIPWFNGGLFQHIVVPPLTADDVAALQTASGLDWSAIDPSIFGTLFERGLDPAKRSQLGAHYTDPATIARLVDPVVQRPLLAEWAALQPAIGKAMARNKRHGDKAWRDAQALFVGYLERLKAYRVLDPACGSGNFLYLALKGLKDIEHRVNLEAEALGLERQHDVTGPHNVLGIEINDYAAELARLTVWIGELQWRIQHGYAFKLNPVLEPLDHIECRDALINADGSEAAWPVADAVVGNPPFVGDKKMRSELGDAYTEQVRRTFQGRVQGGADLVCYWFEKARAQIEGGQLQRAGLVATNSIRGGRNREVLDRIVGTTSIFEAWSDEPWVNEGAAVRVSLVAFGHGSKAPQLNGAAVATISADLTDAGPTGSGDLTEAVRLPANMDTCFQGSSKVGAFEISRDRAREWLALPNPNGHSNSQVVRPWLNGMDITRRPSETWIVDFGTSMSEDDSAQFEAPFQYLVHAVRAERLANNREAYRRYWWRHAEARAGMRTALSKCPRFVATPRVSKHRVFVWRHASELPDTAVVVAARADDTTFGVLHSRLHELWSLRLGTSLEDRPRYTPTTCFETFPFPSGLTPRDTAHQRTEAIDGSALIPADLPPNVRPHAEAIARAAQRLVTLRDAWLNPPEWTERVPEVVPLGMDHSPYPDRIVARPGFEKALAQRTLTKLYNERPAWLQQAHAALDAAVAAAYGWADWDAGAGGLADDDILRRLLALNLERAPIVANRRSNEQPFFKKVVRFAARGPQKNRPSLSAGDMQDTHSPEAERFSQGVTKAQLEEQIERRRQRRVQAEAELAHIRAMMAAAGKEATQDVQFSEFGSPDAIEEPPHDPRNVPVWFVTNRAPLPANERDADDPCSAFSNRDSDTLSYGRVVVNVPQGHVPGSLGSGFWARLVKGVDDRLRPVQLTPLAEADFWRDLGAAMADDRKNGPSRDALFYLHGYCNSFRDAALRTAQLAYDLRIHPAVFFAWPSRGTANDYLADTEAVRLSRDAIDAFLLRLDDCARQAGAALHVVAHSMGNRALLDALEHLASRARADGYAIDQVVFAAPDVSSAQFTQSLKKILAGGIGHRRTLYVSRRDRALWASRVANSFDRAGLAPPVTVLDGVDTIDATDVDTTFLGHSYVASVRALIADLKTLLAARLAPGQRTGVEPVDAETPQPYWRLS